MENFKKWYDSVWLNQYLAARFHIFEKYPDQSQGFVNSFDCLRTRRDFETIKISGFLNEEDLNACKQQVRSIDPVDLENHELLKFGRLVKHDLPFFVQMQNRLTEFVSAAVGEEVEPNYNFLSLYNNLGVCGLHMDSPEAKWTLDICIEHSGEWPIHISNVVNWPESQATQNEDWTEAILNNPEINFNEFIQQPGDALIFAGSSQWHYRDRIPVTSKQNFAHLIFFHYIPKGTRPLVQPSLWAELFNIPELSSIVGE